MLETVNFTAHHLKRRTLLHISSPQNLEHLCRHLGTMVHDVASIVVVFFFCVFVVKIKHTQLYINNYCLPSALQHC